VLEMKQPEVSGGDGHESNYMIVREKYAVLV
jgi:hypothetical protein